MATIVEEGGGTGGSSVIANPTLVGTEALLTGLEVDGTKYKVPSGGSGDIPVATSETLGGIKTGGVPESGNYLSIELDNYDAAYVDTTSVYIGSGDVGDLTASNLTAGYTNIGSDGSSVNLGSTGESGNSSSINIGEENFIDSLTPVYTTTHIRGDITVGSIVFSDPDSAAYTSTIYIGNHDERDTVSVSTSTYFRGDVNFSDANVTGLNTDAGVKLMHHNKYVCTLTVQHPILLV